MGYWLFKSEPSDYSIDDLANAEHQTSCWEGIRNYQVRNFIRDDMKVGDQVMFYHSSCKHVGVVGLAEIVKEAHPDHTQFDPESKYYDPKSKQENPRWLMVDIKLVSKLPKLIPLSDIKACEHITEIPLVRKASRLSIMPVSKREWDLILSL